MSIICAIHQPNFFPWLGYFDKIKRSDIFVFLDDVQMPKTGSSWVNRTKLNCAGREKFYTVPIKRNHGFTLIKEIEFATSDWKDVFLNILTNYYRTTGAHADVIKNISGFLYKKEYVYLADLNKDIIVHFSEIFGYKTQFISKSELNIHSKSTEMLVDVCKAVGATSYLCGGGAGGYQEDELFEKADINLIYQNYTPLPYGETKEYISGLSVIDFLIKKCGLEIGGEFFRC